MKPSRNFKYTIAIIAYLVTNCFSVVCYSFDIKVHCRLYFHLTNDELIEQFPYDEYLNSVAFTDFNTLQGHREYLQYFKKSGERYKTIGDDFLYFLGEHFLKYYPITHQSIIKKITIAESYLNPSNKGFGLADYRKNEVYQTIGYFILGRVASYLQEEIKQKRWDISTDTHKEIIRRLKANKIYLSIQTDTLTKIKFHLKNGNYQYILNRIYCKIQGLMGSVLKYLQQFESIKDYLPNKQTRMTLKLYHQYSPTISGESPVNIYEIFDNQQIIGYSIWMKRPDLKANYFAFQTNTKSVYQRYQHWVSSQNRRVVLVTTGGFTNRRRQPEGLTVERGRIVNAVTLPERHGLVIVSKGGLRVLNLKRNAFTLPLTSNNTTRAINPLNSLMDFSALIKWSLKNDATLFQTQLLAYSDQLLIDKSKARINPRERRILALIRDQNNCVHHIIFHIKRNYNLADIADHIFQLLKTRVKKIEAILNLDVGSYNILHVYDENRNQIKDITGPVHINNATNLIVYTR